MHDLSASLPPEEPEFGLRLELVRYVFSLPDETRAKLLAFLHLADDLAQVQASLDLARPGTMRLTLSCIASD